MKKPKLAQVPKWIPGVCYHCGQSKLDGIDVRWCTKRAQAGKSTCFPLAAVAKEK